MRETPYWIWHILTGIIVLVFLGLHMIVMHFDGTISLSNPAGGSATNWENVIYRSQTAFYAITYIVLLGAALYHGLYGLRTILCELKSGRKFQKCLSIVFWLVGVCLFLIGSYASFVAQRMAIGG